MNPLEYLSSLPIMQALGWTLLHFLWQGALVAAAVGLLLALLRGRSANARYVACCAGMALMIAAPLATLGFMSWTFLSIITLTVSESSCRLKSFTTSKTPL